MNMGPAAATALPVLWQALGHSDHQTRVDAVGALVQIAPRSVASIITEVVRRDAVAALGAGMALRHNPQAGEAVPGLVALLQSGDIGEREMAAYALENVGSRAGDAVPALVAALRDPDPKVRRRAEAALRAIGTPEALRSLGQR